MIEDKETLVFVRMIEEYFLMATNELKFLITEYVKDIEKTQNPLTRREIKWIKNTLLNGAMFLRCDYVFKSLSLGDKSFELSNDTFRAITKLLDKDPDMGYITTLNESHNAEITKDMPVLNTIWHDFMEMRGHAAIYGHWNRRNLYGIIGHLLAIFDNLEAMLEFWVYLFRSSEKKTHHYAGETYAATKSELEKIKNKNMNINDQEIHGKNTNVSTYDLDCNSVEFIIYILYYLIFKFYDTAIVACKPIEKKEAIVSQKTESRQETRVVKQYEEAAPSLPFDETKERRVEFSSPDGLISGVVTGPKDPQE
jgi:hypothetical protein